MSRIFSNKNLLLCGLFPNIEVNSVDFDKFKEARGLLIEDPWERVKSIFSTDDMGNIHPELKYAIDMAQIGLFTGAVYGGTIESIKKTDNFIRTNDTKVYLSKNEMYKILSNENFKGFFKGAFHWGPQFAFFFGGFSLISSCCEAYRNKYEVFDNTVAGFAVGSVCRLFLGPKGMLSGGIVGGVLGTIYGTLQWIRYKITKVDNVQVKYAHFAFNRHRELLSKGVIKREAEDNSKKEGSPVIEELDNFEVKDDDDDNKKT